MPTPALAVAASGAALGHLLPIWSVAPFGLILLGIAVLPLGRRTLLGAEPATRRW